tara:strand:+ start:1455 stop:1790 length:336 start_codon:yes stop_codon:yes gene_type:complete
MAGTFECETVNVTNMVPTTMSMGKLIMDMKDNSTRPSSPVTGQMIYNSSQERAEVWTGSEWKILGLRLTFPVWTDSTKPSTSGLPNGYAGWNTDQETLQVWNQSTNKWQPE